MLSSAQNARAQKAQALAPEQWQREAEVSCLIGFTYQSTSYRHRR